MKYPFCWGDQGKYRIKVKEEQAFVLNKKLYTKFERETKPFLRFL